MSTVALAEQEQTPYLAVDLDVLQTNLTAMATRAARLGVLLRPHVKTHKSVEIARRQVELGAVGLTVATVSEAEVFASAGFPDVFIAYPVWAEGTRGARLRTLAGTTQLSVGVDSAPALELLGTALRGTTARVLIEVDSGHHRSGVAPEDVEALAVRAGDHDLQIGGVFTFPGHAYAPGRRASAAAQEAAVLSQAQDAIQRAGWPRGTASGGSTPTMGVSDGAVGELRPGVYVFNDAQQVELGTAEFEDVALTAVGTVVSARGRAIIIDAGSKVVAADRPDWATGFGRLPDHPGARITALSEHHATVEFNPGTSTPSLGSRVRIAPNHVCSAVNLADDLVVTSSGVVVDRWPVSARGRNT